MTDNVVGQAYVELGILDKTKAQISKIKSDMKNSLTGADLNLSLTDGMNDSLDEMTKQLNKIKGISLTNLVTGFRAVGDAAYSAVKEMGKISNVSKDLKFFLKDNKEITDYMRNGFLPLGQFKNVDEMKGKLEELIKTSTKLRAIRFATGKDYSTSDLFGGAGLQITRSSNALKSFVLKSADSFKYMRGQANLLGKSIKNTFMNSELGKGIQSFKSGIVQLSKSFAPLIATVATVAASIAALTIAIKTCLEQAKKIDEIGDAADKIGTSYSSYAKYSKLGEVLGYSSSDYESAFKKMRVNQAKGSDAFAQLGISNASGKSSTELFDETVKKLQNVQDETERTRLAVEVFGKSATNITPLLSTAGEEVDRLSNAFKTLGAVTSDSTVKRADTLQNDIYMLKQAVEGFKNSMTGFIPIIDWVVSKLTLVIGYATVIMEIIFGIKQDTEEAASSMDDYTDSVEEATEAVEELKAGIRGFDELNNLTFDSATTSLGIDDDEIEDVNDSLGSVSEAMDETLQKIQAFRDWASGFAEEYGAIIPWLLLIVNAIIGTILCLTGHPILALPFFLAAGVGFAGIVSQISNTEDLDADGTGWDDYFKGMSEDMQGWAVALNIIIPIVCILAGLLLLFLAPSVVAKVAGIALIVTGVAIAAISLSSLEDLDDDGHVSWSEYIENIQNTLQSDNWKVIAAFVLILAGVLCILFAPGVVGKIAGFAMILLGIVLPGVDIDTIKTCSENNIGFFGTYIISLATSLKDETGAMKTTVDLLAFVAIIGGILLVIFGGIAAKAAGVVLILFAGLVEIANQDVVQAYLEDLDENPEGFKWEEFKIVLLEGLGDFSTSVTGEITKFILLVGGILLIIFGETAMKLAGIAMVITALGLGSIGGIKKETWDQLSKEGLNSETSKQIVFDLGITTNVTTNISEKANNLSDKMKSWSSDVKMASGGIVDNPGSGVRATVGEAGKEAVLPLENNTAWMDDLVKKINNDSDNRPVNITLEMDGKRVAQGVVKNINELTRSSGKLNLNFV